MRSVVPSSMCAASIRAQSMLFAIMTDTFALPILRFWCTPTIMQDALHHNAFVVVRLHLHHTALKLIIIILKHPMYIYEDGGSHDEHNRTHYFYMRFCFCILKKRLQGKNRHRNKMRKVMNRKQPGHRMLLLRRSTNINGYSRLHQKRTRCSTKFLRIMPKIIYVFPSKFSSFGTVSCLISLTLDECTGRRYICIYIFFNLHEDMAKRDSEKY